jgi:acyl transferase domain-containing protein
MESRVMPIAVIGMGCRLPGGIDSSEAFWQALLRGNDLVTEIPADRWDVEEHYDPDQGVRGLHANARHTGLASQSQPQHQAHW